MTKARFVRSVALVAVFALITAIQPASPAIAATACSLTQLEPQLGELMVTQGVGGTTSNAYSLLTRGKETLAKAFLTLPTSCTVGTGYIKVTDAKLDMSNLDSATRTLLPNTLFTNVGGSPSIPATTAQASSPADPIFVVPAANAVQGATDTSFTATFTATITYTRKSQGSATVETGKTKVFTQTKSFERQTNALRILVIPMGDATQAYINSYTPADQQIVQNAMQTLARIYPVPNGIATLADSTGGLRYTVDTATMLDLKPLFGATTNKFCGTSSNFATIKGLLAQYLLSHNTANPGATADRVVGVVDQNFSFGGSSGCAEGMASVSSAESWVRLIADQPGVPSMSGALASMEVSHTFALEQASATYHSGTVEADRSTSRAHNQANRAPIANDHDVMDFNTSTGPWDNTTTLLSAGDFSYLLCKLKPSSGGSTSACATPGNIGTATGVLAGEKYIIAGTTDGTVGNTQVVEPYYANNVAEIASAADSLLWLVQLDGGSIVAGGKFGVPWSLVESLHQTSPSTSTASNPALRTFYAAAPGFSTVAGEVRLVKVATAPTPPNPPSDTALLSGTTLFSSLKIAPPVITTITGNGVPTSGGNVTLNRSQITPRIPPKPDILFLADTTGSMGPALQNVRDNIVTIMQDVIAVQPDAQFAAASYKDEFAFCATDPYTFRIEQPLTSSQSALQTAITPTAIANSGWQTATGQGCDQPEAQLNALYRVGFGNDGNGDVPVSVGYRSGSTPVVVWFGDAPGHDPSVGHTEADAIAQLQGRGARVVAVNMSSLENSSLDDTGQATRIAAATKGVVKSSNDGSEVSSAILSGLHDLPATVTPFIDTPNCDRPPLTVGFNPEQQTVPSGTTANFTENVTVAAGTAPGTYQCLIYFKINGNIVYSPGGGEFPSPDPSFYQNLQVVVNDSPRQQVTVTATSTAPERLKLDLIYRCNAFDFLAAVAIAPSSLDGNVATFNANADRTNACAQFGGGGTLVPFVSDGWNRVGETVQSSTSSDVKAPTAAIYSPATNASIEWNATLPLRGSGEVAGIELPGSALSWSIRPPGSTTFTTVGGGSSVDVPAPSPNGWTQGSWTARLTVSSPGGTATADVTFGARYQFIGFFSPVQNPPAINTGTAGKSFALKWQLMSAGTPVNNLASATSMTYALAACGPAVPAGFAATSGQSMLRFDQTNMQFLFNWQTPSTPGTYIFRLTLNDGSTHDACVNLTK